MIGCKLGIFNQSVDSGFAFGNVFKTFGGTDYAECDSNLTALNSATAASLHCWVKVESGKVAVFGDNQSSTNRFAINPWSDDKIYFNCANGSTSSANTDFSSYHGGWALISLVYDNAAGGTNADKLKAYINASLISLTFVGTIPSSLFATCGNQMQINKGGSFGFFGEAEYAIPVITSDASTPTQIANFYNSGNGAFPEDCFTNIISNPNTNQANGATSMDGRLSTPDYSLINVSTPPAYFVPKT